MSLPKSAINLVASGLHQIVGDHDEDRGTSEINKPSKHFQFSLPYSLF